MGVSKGSRPSGRYSYAGNELLKKHAKVKLAWYIAKLLHMPRWCLPMRYKLHYVDETGDMLIGEFGDLSQARSEALIILRELEAGGAEIGYIEIRDDVGVCVSQVDRSPSH